MSRRHTATTAHASTLTPDGFRLRNAATGHTVTNAVERAAVAELAFVARSMARATGSRGAATSADVFGVPVTVEWTRTDADMAVTR
jgi:hypothetical protein